jgi:hypothetical protein
VNDSQEWFVPMHTPRSQFSAYVHRQLQRGDGVRVEARDLQRGRILLGGLGVLGIHAVWYPECEEHKALPGYKTAPVRTSRLCGE